MVRQASARSTRPSRFVVSQPMWRSAPSFCQRRCQLLFSERNLLRCAPDAIEVFLSDQLGFRKEHPPFWLAAEFQTEELTKLVAPMGSIVTQRVSIIENLDLANDILVV